MSPTLHLGHFPKILAHSSFCPTLKFLQWPFGSNSPLWLHPQQVTSLDPFCPELQWHRILQLLGHRTHSWPQVFAQAVPLVCWNVLIPLPYLFFWLSPLILSFSAQRLLYLQIGFLWPKALKPMYILVWVPHKQIWVHIVGLGGDHREYW